MIVAHLSDLHLGFRAYGRTERGADVRERDVALAWERAVQELLRLAPDVVVVAGDVFDRPDPPPGALVTLARGLELLRSSLPATPVLMVAGPRDTPRRPGDPGALAVLDTFPNVEAAAGLPRSIIIERLDLHASLVPYRAVARDPAFVPEPDPEARWNMLVLHACESARDQPGVFVDASEWDYLALGGEHRRREISSNAQYSGSLERVALDPWDEAADEKGFLTFDLERGETTFHPIPGRAVAALASVRVSPGDPERLRRRVREVIREVPGGIAGKIVRLRLDGVDPEDLLALQGELLQSLRGKALHLAVEAGREIRRPSEASLPADAPRLLREAVEAELRRNGVLTEATSEQLRMLAPDPGGPGLPRVPLGTLEAVDGEVPGVGRVSTSIRPGLTAVIGGAGRSRTAVAALLIESAEGTDGPLARLWAGRGAETLDGAVHQGVEAVAESRGFAVVRAALDRARDLGAPGSNERDPRTDRAPLSGGAAVHVDPGMVEAEFTSAERELSTLRADAAEVTGDVEVATMDWLRERQDAETTLNAYRDRARELKVRLRRMEAVGPTSPCPTCGRVLESHYQDVLVELRNEWEAVVQDGRWWRRRWEQLEPKPAHLQELEGHSLRVHAALEATSERVELLRSRLLDLEVPSAVGALTDGPFGDVVVALLRVRDARLAHARETLLSRASRLLGQITGGRLLAATWRDGTAQLQGDSGPLVPLSEDDLAAGRLALRLAAASLVAASGQPVASLVVEEPFDRLDAEAALRTLALLRTLLAQIPRIVLVSRGDAVDARPELFDAVFEVRDDAGSGSAALRPAAAGAGSVFLGETVRPPRGAVPRH